MSTDPVLDWPSSALLLVESSDLSSGGTSEQTFRLERVLEEVPEPELVLGLVQE